MLGQTEAGADKPADGAVLRNQLPYGVIKVRKDGEPADSNEPCHARRNEAICVQVQDLATWLREMQAKEGPPRPRNTEDLILYLGGEPMLGLHPERIDQWYTTDAKGIITSLRFTLDRNASNQAAWKKLLRYPVFTRPVEVSVGFEGGQRIQSWVYPMPDPATSKFFLVVIPKAQLVIGAIIILGAFLAFLALARTTDIVRDPNLPLRPDGRRPLSLARAQMAFWFFLVVGSYFFLWLLTGDTDTMNSSIVALTGISAATAVSSALIDSAKDKDADFDRDVAAVDLKQPRRGILVQLKSILQGIQKQFEATIEARAGIPATDSAALAANAKAQAELREKCRTIEKHLDFFRQPLWRVAMHDLLSERGVITFHRFQMCVWTIVLGIIFVITVYSEVAMPEFSVTLLGLMGVSAGTFIGFKLPEENRPPKGLSGRP